MNMISRSDESFVELVQDETKRASTLANWRGGRTMFFWMCMVPFGSSIFLQILYLMLTTDYSNGSTTYSLSILMFAICIMFMSLWASCDNKVKLILCIGRDAEAKNRDNKPNRHITQPTSCPGHDPAYSP